MAVVETATLVFEGREPSDSSVPVDVLLRTLAGVQQLVLILAASAEGLPVQQRFKPPLELRLRHALRCGVPAAGSYRLPLELVDETPQPRLDRSPVLGPMQALLGAVGAADEPAARRLLPDSRYRERALREARRVVPQPGEPWAVGLAVPDRPPVQLRATAQDTVERWLREAVTDQSMLTVTGELVRISFDENRFVIRHPVTGRLLDCTYTAEIEDDLLARRRDLVQVTGVFQMDGSGQPVKLTDVVEVQAVDLSPLVLERVECPGLSLVAEPPLVVTPELDEARQSYVVEDEALDLYVFADTRPALVDELAEHLCIAWRAYALAEPEQLVAAAQALRLTLLARFREVA